MTDQAIVSAAAFLTNIILARTLGITLYGRFSVIILIQLFLLSLQQAASSGIFQVMYAGMKKNDAHAYASSLLYMQGILYSVVGIASLFMFGIFRHLVSEYELLNLPGLLGTVLFLFQDLLRKMLITMKREMAALFIDCITNLLQIAIILFFALKGQMTLPLACWIIALTFIPSVIAGIIWLRPCSFESVSFRTVYHIHKKQSSWMLMSALLQWLAGNLFVMASGVWLGAAALGALRLAQYVFGLLNVFIQAVENYAIPHAAGLQSSPDMLYGFLKNVLKKSLLLVGPILILLGVFSDRFMRLSGGSSYGGYGYILKGLSIVYLLVLAGIPVRILLRIKLQNQSYFLGYCLASLFSVVTARFLISHWQLAGVLTGLFFTQFIVLLYWIIALNKKKIC